MLSVLTHSLHGKMCSEVRVKRIPLSYSHTVTRLQLD